MSGKHCQEVVSFKCNIDALMIHMDSQCEALMLDLMLSRDSQFKMLH